MRKKQLAIIPQWVVDILEEKGYGVKYALDPKVISSTLSVDDVAKYQIVLNDYFKLLPIHNQYEGQNGIWEDFNKPISFWVSVQELTELNIFDFITANEMYLTKGIENGFIGQEKQSEFLFGPLEETVTKDQILFKIIIIDENTIGVVPCKKEGLTTKDMLEELLSHLASTVPFDKIVTTTLFKQVLKFL